MWPFTKRTETRSSDGEGYEGRDPVGFRVAGNEPGAGASDGGVGGG